jgi:hypothetical protein
LAGGDDFPGLSVLKGGAHTVAEIEDGLVVNDRMKELEFARTELCDEVAPLVGLGIDDGEKGVGREGDAGDGAIETFGDPGTATTFGWPMRVTVRGGVDNLCFQSAEAPGEQVQLAIDDHGFSDKEFQCMLHKIFVLRNSVGTLPDPITAESNLFSGSMMAGRVRHIMSDCLF